MRSSDHISLAPNFKVEGKFNAELFLKTAMNALFKAEGYGVEVASVSVTPSDKPEIIVHRV